MNEKMSSAYFRSKGLLPFQAKFAQDFLGNKDKKYWELVAPTGSGKGHLTVVLLASEIEENPDKKILVLAPWRNLVDQWYSELQSFGSPFTLANIKIVKVDRQKYLELESKVPVGKSPWALVNVALMSIDLAKRKDIASSLSKARWDIVVFDESHALVGQRRAFFHKLIISGAMDRALLLTNKETPLLDENISRIKITFEDMVSWEGQPIFAEFRRKLIMIDYRRSPEEQNFLIQLQDFAEQLAREWSYGKPIKRILYNVASSCIYTTKRIMNRLHDSWRLMRNKIDHDISWTKEDMIKIQLKLPNVVEEAPDLDIKPETFLTLYQKIESLRDQIEEIPIDSKLDTLVDHIIKCLRNIPEPHFCILSQFSHTIDYITSNIQELYVPIHSLTSATTPAERKRILEAFENSGGVLVATDASLAGEILENVDECINYDLPLTTAAFERRWKHFEGVNRKREFNMAVLRDQSSAFSWEKRHVRAHAASIR